VRRKLEDLEELPFTAIVFPDGWGGPNDLAQPLYGDGTLGEPSRELADEAHTGKYGGYSCGTEQAMIIPFYGKPHLTPYGPTSWPQSIDGIDNYKRDKLGKPLHLTAAALAEGRRLTHGHYGFYSDDEIRAIIANEGLEQGVCGYDAVENYNELTRPLALAVEDACAARDDYLNRLYEAVPRNDNAAYDAVSAQTHRAAKGQALPEDDVEVSRLITAAETAKQALCAQLQIDNEPWDAKDW
jgi:hypothetical protein